MTLSGWWPLVIVIAVFAIAIAVVIVVNKHSYGFRVLEFEAALQRSDTELSELAQGNFSGSRAELVEGSSSGEVVVAGPTPTPPATDTDLDLGKLLEYNRKLLERYHGIATGQAGQSFKSGQIAMWAGFGWLLGCAIVAVALQASTGSQIVLGSLAAVGGALSGFIGRTYIRVYERASTQLNDYFRQPLRNSYLLSSERIIERMPKAIQAEAYGKLLDAMLTRDEAPKPPSAPAP